MYSYIVKLLLTLIFTVGIYQPVSNEMVIPGVIAVGTVGVWRLLCSDFTTAQQEILVKMKDRAWNIQPEKENFILTELSISIYVYCFLFAVKMFRGFVDYFVTMKVSKRNFSTHVVERPVVIC